jgi:molybdopterin molybdotransferase
VSRRPTIRPAPLPDADWFEARRIALEVGRSAPAATERLPLDAASGRTLAVDVTALSPLPAFSSSAMDGWAVAGDGPWLLGSPIAAGSVEIARRLEEGTGRPVATGAMIPPGTRAVLRLEHGVVSDTPRGRELRRAPGIADDEPRRGAHMRIEGEEAPLGAVLVAAGAVLTPPRLALAAAGGCDSVVVRRRPTVELLVLGDELVGAGVATRGLVRDAYGPQLPALLDSLGLRTTGVRHVGDDLDVTTAALLASHADLVLVTGGSSHGAADHARAALLAAGGRVLVDGVAMRPGHPVILGLLADGRPALCLPGNPAAGLLALVSLGIPLVDGLLGRTPAPLGGETVGSDIPGTGHGVSLVAAVVADGGARPCGLQSPSMLTGLAAADTVLVVGPEGATAGERVAALRLPW